MIAIAITSCDDTTDTIGGSISGNMDNVDIQTAVYNITSRSIISDSVLSRNTTGYLGKVKDPETGSYVTSDFMTQFQALEYFSFPEQDSLAYYDADSVLHRGIIKADSCELRLFYDTFYGDSLAPMKLTAYEMSKPMLENRNYYSNFDPIANGYIREEGICKDKSYSLVDLSVSEDDRGEDDYTNNIRILLNDEYTDKDGKKYNNYGTYIMQKYYDDPENYKNSITFAHNVVPGFYFKSKSGLGSIANISNSMLLLYFSYLDGDSVVTGMTKFAGTEEVLQTSNISNDKAVISQLAADRTCTYIKSPAGLFTELTIPVDEIIRGHEKDTINSAKLTLTRINNNVQSKYSLNVPSTLLMIPKDSLYSFFENQQIANYKNSFIASWSYSTSSGNYDNTYVYNNIANMVSAMNSSDRRSPDWNKVVLIPVTVSYNSSGTLTKVVHDMSLTSTKLIGGPDNPNEPIKLEVIYSRFK